MGNKDLADSMTLKDYEQIRERLESPSSIVIGDVADFFHPFEPEKVRGWSGKVRYESDLSDMLIRLARMENGSIWVAVCLRTLLDRLNRAYELHGPPFTTPHEVSNSQANLSYRMFNSVLKNEELTRDSNGIPAFDYAKEWKGLLWRFEQYIKIVALDIELIKAGGGTTGSDRSWWSSWDIPPKEQWSWELGRLHIWVAHFNMVYREITQLSQPNYIPQIWKHCQCRVAVRLGKKEN